MPPRTPVFQLRVTILEIDPPVWRRILVPANLPLHRLHDVLQRCFSWEDYHLHSFMHREVEYSVPALADGAPVVDTRRVRLNALMRAPGDTLLYQYDFGDGWEHELALEAAIPTESELAVPVCLGGARAGPPEDAGGPVHYTRMLDMRDPSHPEFADAVEYGVWLGRGYDPEAFSVATVNARLQRLPWIRWPTPTGDRP